MYTDKYIALLEEENARQRSIMPNLNKASKKVTDDWLLAVNEWNEAVDKLHTTRMKYLETNS